MVGAFLCLRFNNRTRTGTVLLPLGAEFSKINAAWDAWVGPERTPARACVTGNLARSDWKVDIMVIAAMPA